MQSNNKSLVSIVIVNWNAGDQLADVVKSIAHYHCDLVDSVIIVDNASSDNSLSIVESLSKLPFPIHIVRNSYNKGFAEGCNQGAILSDSKYILFLNPDVRLFENSLSVPVKFMQQPENNNIGICGISLIDELGNRSTSAAHFPTLRIFVGKSLGLTKFFPKAFPKHLICSIDNYKGGQVDQVIGAFFLIRRKVFDLCNGFDDRFFVYFEEVDLSLRARKLGYLSYLITEIAAFHKGGGCSDRVKAARLFYSLRSRILYAQKHYSLVEFLGLLLLTLIEFPLRVMQGIVRFSLSDINNTFSAYVSLFAYFLRGLIWR